MRAKEFLDKITPSIKAIANKHGVPTGQIVYQLAKGVRVELEHTSNHDIAHEIALDHLSEFPDYYDRLETIEK